LEVWEDAVYIRAAKLSLMLLTSINIFENTGLSRSVPSLHRAWFSNVMGKPTNLFFMEIKKTIATKTADEKRLLITVDDEKVILVLDHQHLIVISREQWESMRDSVENLKH
jgi:hypothetical protein